MHNVQSGAAHAVLSDRFYIIGGANCDNRRLNSAQCYDATANKWHTVAPMRRKRSDAVACASFDGFIYVCGGLGIKKCVSSIERYDPQENAWTEVMY